MCHSLFLYFHNARPVAVSVLCPVASAADSLIAASLLYVEIMAHSYYHILADTKHIISGAPCMHECAFFLGSSGCTLVPWLVSEGQSVADSSTEQDLRWLAESLN